MIITGGFTPYPKEPVPAAIKVIAGIVLFEMTLLVTVFVHWVAS